MQEHDRKTFVTSTQTTTFYQRGRSEHGAMMELEGCESHDGEGKSRKKKHDECYKTESEYKIYLLVVSQH